jgi:hypothetical protein
VTGVYTLRGRRPHRSGVGPQRSLPLRCDQRRTASSADADSGIASYALPTLAAEWTGTAGALGVRTHSWSTANPTAPAGAQNITATTTPR